MRLTKKQIEQLNLFESLLKRWNKTQNLISNKQEKKIKEHIQDSLSVHPLLGVNILDLGSGGGFPGIPLAVVSPKKNVFLVERNERKAAFLLNCINRLGLSKAIVINKNSEDLLPDSFPRPLEVITRAFGSPLKAIFASKKLLEEPGASLKMMKTLPFVGAEDIPKSYQINKIENIETKGRDEQHILVTIVQKKKCTR